MSSKSICLSREAYTYWPQHCHGTGWDLFDQLDWPNIQRIDDREAFEDDSDAAFHVICAAAFWLINDAGPLEFDMIDERVDGIVAEAVS
jgi:hypothetical protein